MKISTVRRLDDSLTTFDPCVKLKLERESLVFEENGNYWIFVRMMEKREIKSGGDGIDIVVNDRVS